MKKKKISVMLLLAILALSICTSAWAATQTGDTEGSADSAQVEQIRRGTSRGTMKELTDEEKAEMEAKREEINTQRTAREEAWNALSDDQKEAVYSLKGEIAELEGELCDLYAEYGLIDETAAEEFKEESDQRIAKMREDNSMPALSQNGIKGGLEKDGPGVGRADRPADVRDKTGTDDSKT